MILAYTLIGLELFLLVVMAIIILIDRVNRRKARRLPVITAEEADANFRSVVDSVRQLLSED